MSLPTLLQKLAEGEGQDHQEGWTTPPQRHSFPKTEAEAEKQNVSCLQPEPTLSPPVG